jgi:hypothetical protein
LYTIPEYFSRFGVPGNDSAKSNQFNIAWYNAPVGQRVDKDEVKAEWQYWYPDIDNYAHIKVIDEEGEINWMKDNKDDQFYDLYNLMGYTHGIAGANVTDSVVVPEYPDMIHSGKAFDTYDAQYNSIYPAPEDIRFTPHKFMSLKDVPPCLVQIQKYPSAEVMIHHGCYMWIDYHCEIEFMSISKIDLQHNMYRQFGLFNPGSDGLRYATRQLQYDNASYHTVVRESNKENIVIDHNNFIPTQDNTNGSKKHGSTTGNIATILYTPIDYFQSSKTDIDYTTYEFYLVDDPLTPVAAPGPVGNYTIVLASATPLAVASSDDDGRVGSIAGVAGRLWWSNNQIKVHLDVPSFTHTVLAPTGNGKVGRPFYILGSKLELNTFVFNAAGVNVATMRWHDLNFVDVTAGPLTPGS